MGEAPWWAVRKSGGRSEAGLTLFLAIAIGAIELALASGFALEAHGVARVVLVLVLPGVFLILRSVALSLGVLFGVVSPDRSGDGWGPLILGCFALFGATIVSFFVGLLA